MPSAKEIAAPEKGNRMASLPKKIKRKHKPKVLVGISKTHTISGYNLELTDQSGDHSKPNFKIIRDPIHSYIHLSPLEEKIVNTKIFLRLRNIKQSATADQTYPAHHVDRFSHSLGVMELAGRMILGAFNNSDSSILDAFLDRCISEFGIKPDKNKAKELVIKLGRLAGLLHDIGHLPFSHLTEGAIDKVSKDLYRGDKDWERFIVAKEGKMPQLHEFASYKIIKENRELNEAFKILKMESLKDLLINLFDSEPRGVFATIHGVISSDVDADRADYLLRDGQTSGIGFGQYDQIRLFESMALCKEGNNFLILPTTDALSSVETFLVERHKLYKYLYYHQRVVLTDQVLVHLIRTLLKFSKKNNHILSNILSLDSFHYSKYTDENLPLDDIYIWGLLRNAYKKLNSYLENKNIEKLPLEEQKEIRTTYSLLRIILFREKISKAVWKNTYDFEAFENEIRQELMHRHDLRPGELTKNKILNLYAQFLPVELAKEYRLKKMRLVFLDEILNTDTYFCIETERCSFVPFKKKEENVSLYSLIDKKKRRLVPITRLSQIVEGLSPARENEMQLFLYIISFHYLSDMEWEKILEKVRQIIKTHLVNLYINRILTNKRKT